MSVEQTAALVAAVTALVVAFTALLVALRAVITEVRATHKLVNARVDQLVTAVHDAAHAAGLAEGQQAAPGEYAPGPAAPSRGAKLPASRD